MTKPDYLKLVRWSDEDECFIGSIPDLCGDCCHGANQLDVYRQLIEIHDHWIASFQEKGEPFPPLLTRPMQEVAC